MSGLVGGRALVVVFVIVALLSALLGMLPLSESEGRERGFETVGNDFGKIVEERETEQERDCPL